MCTMRVVVTREMLGNREVCWSLWSGKDVMELTSNQIKNLIKSGIRVLGLTIGKDGELVPDKEGFYCTDIMEHRHCGQYSPMIGESNMVNVFYIVTGESEKAGKKVYDCISTKYEQILLSEEDLRVYLKLGIVSAGAKLDGNKIIRPQADTGKKVTAAKSEKSAADKAEKPS